MTKDIFITNQDPRTNRRLVLESSMHSLWAYLLAPYTNEIEADGFVCSLVEPKDFIEMPMDKSSPPPLVKQYATASSFVRDLRMEQLKIVWFEQEVKVLINEEPYLVINMDTKVSKSKSISQSGPYGLPLP